MNLRCYCCGEKLGDRFVLGAHQFKEHPTNDRVFVFKEGHELRAVDVGRTFAIQIVERKT